MTITEEMISTRPELETGDVVSITDSVGRTYEATVGFKKDQTLQVIPLEDEEATIFVSVGEVTRIIMRPSVVRSALASAVKDWDDLTETNRMFWCIEAEQSIIETGHFEISGRKNSSEVPRHIEGN